MLDHFFAILFSYLLTPWGVIAFIFWLGMVVDCCRQEVGHRRHWWLCFMVLLHVGGAVLYAIKCWWPRVSSPKAKVLLPYWLQTKPKNDAEVLQAEADARNIGKLRQFLRLGDLRYDRGELEQAESAYDQALSQDGENARALWGMANIAVSQGSLEQARDWLSQLMAVDPDFQFGEGGTFYAQVLFELKDWKTARECLLRQCDRHSNPADDLLLAQVYQHLGEPGLARATLEQMLLRMNGAPPYFQQQHRKCLTVGKKLLNQFA